MIKSLRESKAKLSELVELASQGEDVLITVRGKVKARLTQVAAAGEKADMAAWAQALGKLQKRHSTGRNALPSEEIVSEDREDRL